MIKYCGDCAKLDKSSPNLWGEYYCKEKCKYVSENKEACYSHIKKDEGGYTPAGCFITTILCNILGYQDNCEILETLRSFRERYLKLSEDGKKLLQEYDQIGPIISEHLKSASIIDAIILMNNYIKPCYDLIKKEKYTLATITYKNMVEELKRKYMLEGINVNYELDTPIEELGKGRIRKQHT